MIKNRVYLDRYDVIVIGGGAGGLTVAIGCAKGGKKVLMIEKEKVGGECTWSGCIPSKAFISHVDFAIKNIWKNREKDIDSSEIFRKVRDVIAEVYSHETPEIMESMGIDFINGRGYFLDNSTIGVDYEGISKSFKGDNIIIATGSSPAIPKIKGIENIEILTNENFFNLEVAPKSIVFIGGGVISLELAFPLAKLGTKVTILEKGELLLPFEEREVAERIENSLKEHGIELILGAEILEIKKSDTPLVDSGKNNISESIVEYKILGKTDKDNQVIDKILKIAAGEKIFISAGRQPTLSLSLENTDIKYNNHGIETDSHMRATKNIYAVGDVTGPYRFSHMAGYGGEVVVQNILIPIFGKKIHYDSVPWVTFTAPEYSRTGLREDEARSKFGDEIVIYRLDESNDRSLAAGENYFMLKVICHKGKIVGAHCVGARAGEVINILQTLVDLEIPLYKYKETLQAYPTYGDMIRKIAKAAYMDHLKENPIIKNFLNF